MAKKTNKKGMKPTVKKARQRKVEPERKVSASKPIDSDVPPDTGTDIPRVRNHEEG